jgi:tRNA pseudouridine38-40 synthase
MVLKKRSANEKEDAELNIKLVIEYDGKNYFGWQRQKNKPSIQAEIEKNLEIILPGNRIKLTGAGRTDAGVHALNQVANFKIKKETFPENFKANSFRKFIYSVNAMLPEDISIKNAEIEDKRFHARYSAIKRLYRYQFVTGKRALYNNRTYLIKTKFDIDLAKEFCKLLIGTHSFKSLCKNKIDKHNFEATIYSAFLRRKRDGLIVFEICANRFLHSMVRAIAGIMLKVASSKITIEEFKNKFLKGEQLRVQYVPSNGLILDKIIYN